MTSLKGRDSQAECIPDMFGLIRLQNDTEPNKDILTNLRHKDRLTASEMFNEITEKPPFRVVFLSGYCTQQVCRDGIGGWFFEGIRSPRYFQPWLGDKERFKTLG